MDSMYKGRRKFTRDQLLFIVEVMISSAVDTFEGQLRQHSTDKKTKVVPWLQELGWNLSILYAQLNDDGMGTGDATDILSYKGFSLEDYLLALQKHRNRNDWNHLDDNRIHDIPIEELTKVFVDVAFGEYLGKKYDNQNLSK